MTVKRKFSDRAHWRRILNKSYKVIYKDNPEFKGFVTLYNINEIRDPLWKEYDHKLLCLADAGYSWLQHFPAKAHYVVTTMFDANHEVVQWYIDICKEQGITSGGVPWFDDLYLDIVKLPTGEMYLLDDDELEEALQAGTITKQEYDLAWKEAKQLLDSINNDEFPIMKLSYLHLNEMMEKQSP